jgi:hypothetical protein
MAEIVVATAVETLEVEITVDGQVYDGVLANAVVGTVYTAYLSSHLMTAGAMNIASATYLGMVAYSFLEAASSFRIRFRKTTALGAGTITMRLVWALSILGKELEYRRVPTHQPDAIVGAASAQNVWQTLIEYKGPMRLYIVDISMAVLAETVEVEITVDGQVYDGTQAAAAGTVYAIYTSALSVAAGNLAFSPTDALTCVAASTKFIEATSIRIRFRKTTANGANTLTAKAVWAKY